MSNEEEVRLNVKAHVKDGDKVVSRDQYEHGVDLAQSKGYTEGQNDVIETISTHVDEELRKQTTQRIIKRINHVIETTTYPKHPVVEEFRNLRDELKEEVEQA